MLETEKESYIRNVCVCRVRERVKVTRMKHENGSEDLRTCLVEHNGIVRQ